MNDITPRKNNEDLLKTRRRSPIRRLRKKILHLLIKHENKEKAIDSFIKTHNNQNLNIKRSTPPLSSTPDLGGIAQKDLSNQTELNIKNSKRRIIFSKNAKAFTVIAILSTVSVLIYAATQETNSNKKEIEQNLFQAMQRVKTIKTLAKEYDYKGIREELTLAQTNFSSITDQISYYSSLKASVGTNPLGTYQTLFESINDINSSINKLLKTIPDNILDIDPQDLATNFTNLSTQVTKTRQKISSINKLNIPPQYMEDINQLQSEIEKIDEALKTYKGYIPNIIKAIGYPDPISYLVLFQNTGERRANGGFIGSFALTTFNDGELISLQVYDTYDFDGRLFEKVAPPPSLRPYRSQIALRDSNHTPDFPTTARNARWFLEHEGGPTVDGVIAIDETFLKELLKVTGPIPLEDHNIDISHSNFFQILEFIIETDKDNPITPKETLIKLVNTIKNKIQADPKKYSEKILSIIKKQIKTKHIHVNFVDPVLQKFAQETNLDGALIAPKENEDTLLIIQTSLSGNKSDYYMQHAYSHTTDISNTNLVTDTVGIRASHTWDQSEKDKFFKLFPRLSKFKKEKQDDLLSILGEGPNKTLMRVLVPRGSTLISSTGINKSEITIRNNESGFTSFEFLQDTLKNKSSNITITYTLPFLYTKEYSFNLIKQQGMNNPAFTKTWNNKGIQTSTEHTIFNDLKLQNKN